MKDLLKSTSNMVQAQAVPVRLEGRVLHLLGTFSAAGMRAKWLHEDNLSFTADPVDFRQAKIPLGSVNSKPFSSQIRTM